MMPMGPISDILPVMSMGPMKSVRFIGAVTAVGYPARDANGPHQPYAS